MSDKIFYYFSVLMQGLPTTLLLSFASIVSACLISILLSVLLTSQKWYITKPIKAYIILFTGTPLLVQLFIIYYGPIQFPSVEAYLSAPQTSFYYGSSHVAVIKKVLLMFWGLLSHPWFCAYLALTLNSAAYTTQIFSGALRAVPQGQWQACIALGMSKMQALKIILPYSLKRALSTYSNEVIFVVKGTALTSTVTLMDIMGYSQYLNGRYYDFSIFIAAGLIYLLINGLLSIIMRLIESRALKFESMQ